MAFAQSLELGRVDRVGDVASNDLDEQFLEFLCSLLDVLDVLVPSVFFFSWFMLALLSAPPLFLPRGLYLFCFAPRTNGAS